MLAAADGFRNSRAVTATCPPKIEELANACVSYVERSVGVKLDFELETLPLLDHYVAEARDSLSIRPEISPLVLHAMAAYFGEVARRRHGGSWRMPTDDPAAWRVELEAAPLSFSPAHVIAVSLRPNDEDFGLSVFEMDAPILEAATKRLAELPPVSEREFSSPSTWLEVMDIIVDVARARRAAQN